MTRTKEKSWVCPNCNTARVPPESMRCNACGMNLGTPHTKRKHAYLKEVIKLNQYDLIIDACAGAGKMILLKEIRSESPDKIIMGSAPLIEKVKRPSTRCAFIECDKKTWKLLRQEVETEPILEDCNRILPDLVDGSRRTLVFMDPNGWGVYPIRKEMMDELSQTPNTDLLIHFSHLIYRNIGFAVKYCDCDDETNRKKAEGYRKGLNIYWGCEDLWRDLHTSQTLAGKEKSRLYAERYTESMRKGNKAEIIRVPESGRCSFYLIFLTKFKVPLRGLNNFISCQ